MIDKDRIARIRARWKNEHKISGADVEWLLMLADLAYAAELRDSTRPLDPLFDRLFGKRPF